MTEPATADLCSLSGSSAERNRTVSTLDPPPLMAGLRTSADFAEASTNQAGINRRRPDNDRTRRTGGPQPWRVKATSCSNAAGRYQPSAERSCRGSYFLSCSMRLFLATGRQLAIGGMNTSRRCSHTVLVYILTDSQEVRENYSQAGTAIRSRHTSWLSHTALCVVRLGNDCTISKSQSPKEGISHGNYQAPYNGYRTKSNHN